MLNLVTVISYKKFYGITVFSLENLSLFLEDIFRFLFYDKSCKVKEAKSSAGKVERRYFASQGRIEYEKV